MKMPFLEAQATSGDVLPVEPSVILKKYPLFSDLVQQPVWEEGLGKGQRAVMVFFEGTIVKVLVKIERQKAKAILSARSFDDCLAAWEMCLKTGQVPWEQEKEPEKPAAKKRK